MEKMSKIRLYMKNGKPSQLRVLPLRNTRGGSRTFQSGATFVKGGGVGVTIHSRTSFEKKLFFCVGEYAKYGFDQQG